MLVFMCVIEVNHKNPEMSALSELGRWLLLTVLTQIISQMGKGQVASNRVISYLTLGLGPCSYVPCSIPS